MNYLQSCLFLLVSFLASVAGAICGIGGGVIIKPTLDLFGWLSVSAISFLSGCTVLSMSCYSVGKSLLAGEKSVDLHTGTPMAVGAAIGGVVGKNLFSLVSGQFENRNAVGAVQGACLLVITLGTLVYTLNKAKIRPLRVRRLIPCLAVGLALGVMSSFLGIGGGPINLVVLGYLFGMDSKTAAANSLYIILFSQATSLCATLLSGSVPEFQPLTLLLMVVGGILGGIAGRIVNKRLDNRAVDKLFVVLMAVIIGISAYNTWQYAHF